MRYGADVTTDITVIASSAGNAGAVYVTDYGGLTWYRDHWDERADTPWQPEFRTWLPKPSANARAIDANHALPAAC